MIKMENKWAARMVASHDFLSSRFRNALLAGGLVIAAMVCQAQSDLPKTYVDILHQLTDLDRLTRLQTGCQGGLFSSWDRNGKTVWGANGDAGQYLRVEPGGEAVMMDIDGPGVIYRTWSANPMGKIRIYLDGSPTPNFEWNFPDLFDGKMPPFIAPLVYRRDSAQSASDCYLPIPFARHIKITADKAHSEYYHFNYVLFPKDNPIPSFRLPLNGEEQVALNAAADAWAHPGRDPKPALPGQKTIKQTVVIAPGQTEALCDLKETGVIRAIRARVKSEQRYVWRKLVLRGSWDGAEQPQIHTPLGPFFSFDWETAEYGSVTSGCQNGQAYQYFPMPFRKSARLAVENHLEKPAEVECEIEWAPLSSIPDDSVYFFARWRHEPDSTTFDYPFLETAGRGHFVGVSMPIDHPLDGWWGEGDEMIWVDDDDFPPYIGTGSEDYFGDAWGIRYLSGPSYGASSMKGHRTCNYRWHFMDFVPFTKRMRMIIENYGPNGQGPRGQYDYSSTAFWYQAELTPPFEQLKGVKFTGGSDPNGKPTVMEYDTKTFGEITTVSLRTYGQGVTFALQAETLLADAVKAGKAKIVTDASLPYEFDREQAVDFGMVEAKTKLAEIKLNVASDGVYYPRIYTAQENGIADISLNQNGQTLPIGSKIKPHVLQLEGLFLTQGEHTLSLESVMGGHAIFDCLQLEPAKRFADAIEAEELQIVRTTGGAEMPRPGKPIPGVSAGRVLEFHADKKDQGFVLNLGKRPALPYVLGVRLMKSPKSGIIQAFAGSQPLGSRVSLCGPGRELMSLVYPIGPVPAGVSEIELRVVGKGDQSQGFDAAVDYFRWEPAILGPGSAEGIRAMVSKTHDCDYRAQDLGPSYSGGHQFWVQPCGPEGWIDIGIIIPKEAVYEFVVKYTKSWDYARIQASLDDKPFGPVADTYSETVVPGEPLSLGKSSLTAGYHMLRFAVAGHNPASKGWLMGIDHVIVKQAD